MEILWAPWRMEYISNMKKMNKHSCIFCKALKAKKDKNNLILYRGEHCFVILNKFPYTHGHLMIAPNRHLAKIEDLCREEKNGMFDLLQESITFLKKELNAQGFNIGMNIGKVAGAGVLGHLHIHLVPRWEGDTNFMPVFARTKVISEDLRKTFRKLNKFKSLEDKNPSKSFKQK